MYGNEWDFYLGGSEAAGGYSSDVAGTWNEHGAQSDFFLDQATDSIDHGGDMLFGAASNLGTNPDVVNGYLGQSVDDFRSTNDAMWQSMGFSGTPDFH